MSGEDKTLGSKTLGKQHNSLSGTEYTYQGARGKYQTLIFLDSLETRTGYIDLGPISQSSRSLN